MNPARLDEGGQCTETLTDNVSPSRPHVARCTTRGGDVTLERVIHDHSVGIESPTQRSDGSFHALDPTTRQAIMVAIIVKWNHHPNVGLAIQCRPNGHGLHAQVLHPRRVWYIERHEVETVIRYPLAFPCIVLPHPIVRDS